MIRSETYYDPNVELFPTKALLFANLQGGGTDRPGLHEKKFTGFKVYPAFL